MNPQSSWVPTELFVQSKVVVYFCTRATSAFLWASIVEWVWVVYTDAFPAHHKCVHSLQMRPPLAPAPDQELVLGLCYMLYLAFLYMTFDFCLYFSTVCAPSFKSICAHTCIYILYIKSVVSRSSAEGDGVVQPGRDCVLANVCHKC